MNQLFKDTAVLGTALWLIGYLASLVLFFTPYAGVMGWILLAFFTPITIVIVLWWFRKRERLPLQYYASVGRACVDADRHRARLPVHRPAVPCELLRNRCVRLLCGDIPHPGGRRTVPEPEPE